ncbi:MAG: protein-L-isoaspartate O-methyltransferase [Burkholderiales bacterium]|nr:protein-L-isoaspartate O-methyltransferase [Burkholderiales bacterium]
MDLEKVRFNMIEQQIRPWDVLDDTVLTLLQRVKREEYVPEAYRAMAFMDLEIPLGQGESMLSPKVEARLVQELHIKPTDKVLEVGTGSGYMTALLASLAKHVHSAEIIPELSQAAAQKLAAHDFSNVTLDVGDAARGWQKHAPYDVIVVTGSLPLLPDEFIAQLNPGGRLLAFIGVAPAMAARLTRLIEPGVTDSEDLFETDVRALKNALQPAQFVF